MTLTIMEDNKSLDIIVKPEQRIQEVYRVLVENGFSLRYQKWCNCKCIQKDKGNI